MSIEEIPFDPEKLALLKKIVEQNDAILRMNESLIERFSAPPMMVINEDIRHEAEAWRFK